MSVLRACQQAFPRNVVARRLQVSARALSTSGTPAETSDKQSSDSEVVPAPPRDILPADIISGAPAELRHRAVRIFQPTRSTTQSGTGKSHRWRIDWEILAGGGRWENPLMGWASSADYMQGTRMSFRSKEDAIHFAEKQGWDYYVQSPEVKRVPPKNYSENYLYQPKQLRLVRTK
ncbi:Ndufs4, NADH dehydrogenase Fe-S protein 4 [Amylocystis lapponica]|nr:Ndufs4, NADH dehydrogenase Fe-S protein 4 [Amylocystis lapponica]